MEQYAGIDVSVESACVCGRRDGRIAREVKLASEPDVLTAWFGSLGFEVRRIGLGAVAGVVGI